MDEEQFKVPAALAKHKFVPPKKATADTAADDNKVLDISPNKTDSPKSIDKIPEQKSKPVENNSTSKKPPAIQCLYKVPKWSDTPTPELQYSFEVLKSGTIVENFSSLQNQPYWLIGKLPENDIVMAHPTISRYHAVFQYRPDVTTSADENDAEEEEEQKKPQKPEIEKGWYIYDLNSTHGTFVNKMKIPPQTYVRVRVGYMLKFGGSTRSFILQGPEFDAEPESELSITEIKEQRKRKEQEYIEKLKAEEKRKEEEGISWGMTEDADEETDLSVNPYASTNNEELFLNDPKKTLRGYFEREGLDLDYKVEEMSMGTFVCTIELPIHDSNGRPIVAEVCHKGKKKDCVFQCAMEACRTLDRHGVLRQAHHESRKRKVERADSDDDDDFYDRTGDVERKRQEKAATNQNNALSYEELLQKEVDLMEKAADIDAKIEKYQQLDKLSKEKESKDDDLDAFMSSLTQEKAIDKIEIRKLRVEAQHIKNDHAKLKRLINIARPINLPPLKLENTTETSNKTGKRVLPLFGKRGQYKFTSTSTKQKSVVPAQKEYKSDEEEVEESEVLSTKPVVSKEVAASMDIDDEDLKDLKTNKNLKEMEINDNLKDMKTNKNSEDMSSPVKNNVEQLEKTEKSPRKLRTREQLSPITPITEVETVDEDDEKAKNSVQKKRRNRIRLRGERGRENVDFDDAEELVDNEKYSTWVPPKNQSGDGSTSLNDKYGY